MQFIIASIRKLFRSTDVSTDKDASLEELVVRVFDYFRHHLPDNWERLMVYYKFDENADQVFVRCKTLNGEAIESHSWLDTSEMIEVGADMRKLTKQVSLGHDRVTHIQLVIEASGQFENLLGYGEVDWDEVWPDDITKQPYTYELGIA